jgi:dipeptidyl aminopeptidase/acylaminoacyl peptidase
LIAQGANDVRVKAAESEQIVAAMQRHGIPVTYIYYADEGHGLVRPENRRSFATVTEAFLAQHLGGRQQPIGDDFDGSTITFRAGHELIPSED